jgi:two-component system sensor histidine kinase/response regulator
MKDSLEMDGAAVMMITSDDRGGDLARSRAVGIHSYLVKPIRRAELREAIMRLLSDPQGSASVSTQVSATVPFPDTRPLRILLVDDLEDNRFLITTYLKKSPYLIEIAENGEIAVEKFKNGEFDVVLMDMQMPVMSGIEATRIIREWEKDRHRAPKPIIALTASALREEIQNSLRAGCSHHLTKPVRKSELIAAILENVPM